MGCTLHRANPPSAINMSGGLLQKKRNQLWIVLVFSIRAKCALTVQAANPNSRARHSYFIHHVAQAPRFLQSLAQGRLSDRVKVFGFGRQTKGGRQKRADRRRGGCSTQKEILSPVLRCFRVLGNQKHDGGAGGAVYVKRVPLSHG